MLTRFAERTDSKSSYSLVVTPSGSRAAPRRAARLERRVSVAAGVFNSGIPN